MTQPSVICENERDRLTFPFLVLVVFIFSPISSNCELNFWILNGELISTRGSETYKVSNSTTRLSRSTIDKNFREWGTCDRVIYIFTIVESFGNWQILLKIIIPHNLYKIYQKWVSRSIRLNFWIWYGSDLLRVRLNFFGVKWDM